MVYDLTDNMMNIPLYYIWKNFLARKLTTGITIAGIALVVFVFAAVLMMADGIQQTLSSTGSNDNVVITRKSSSGEITSIIDRATADLISTMPMIQKDETGKPLLTSDAVTILNAPKKDGGGLSNLAVRGVSENALKIRNKITIISGRMFTFGARELIVGKAIEERFSNIAIGNTIKFAGDNWVIVGIMDAEKSAFESELWCDANQLIQAFNRVDYSTLTFRISDNANIEQLKAIFAGDKRLNQYEPEIERKYFEKQSEAMRLFIQVLGITITVIFSVGAMIGAMITMYAAVANRTTEIGTLRALGFQRLSILIAFLVESLITAFIGGFIGIGLASILQFYSISTLNFGSFSELSFSFALTSNVIQGALTFTGIMGFIGGFLPAVKASRMSILSALR
jgi:ABC-type antimicrobial peptide transport system permease subunit